jgi:hypothetical protein
MVKLYWGKKQVVVKPKTVEKRVCQQKYHAFKKLYFENFFLSTYRLRTEIILIIIMVKNDFFIHDIKYFNIYI